MSYRSSIFKFPLLFFQSYSLKSHYRPQLSLTISYPCTFLQSLGVLKRVHVGSELEGLYSDFEDMGRCMFVMRSTIEPRTRVWNLVMKRQIEVGSFDSALRVFVEMRRLGVEVDSFTLPIVNHAISMHGTNVLIGQMIHCVGIELGFVSDVYFCNTLIEVYVKSDNTVYARKVFDEMCQRDLVSWTSMVSGYVGEGSTLQAFKLFDQMRVVEVEPNSVTMITMLQACSSCESVMQLHGYLLKAGFLDDTSVRNSLLKAYSNWTSYEGDIETLFHEYVRPDVVSWNIFMSFQILKRDVIGTKQMFIDMLQDVAPNAETLTIAATALSKSRNFDHGPQLHCLAIKYGLCDLVLLTCLLNIYSKCGDLDSSTRLFRELPQRNTIAWSSMMSGFIEHGHHEKAIELIKKIKAAELHNKPEIIGSLLDGYADLGALHKGKEIHAYFLRNLSINSMETNYISETSIINMYAKCGSISYARNCFRSMTTKDVIAWTSMIEGLGTYGLGLEALELFNQMLNEGLTPNSITFLSLLSACAHSGLAAQGCKLFNAMKWDFRIEPELQHYTCIVDLLGRSGKLKEALCMILKMQCFQDSRIWGALLAACSTYTDRKIGSYAAKRVMELEPENVGYYVVLSNMKASAEQWDEVEELRRSVNIMDLKKVPGWSCIETTGRIVGFVSSDTSHPDSGEIYDISGFLRWQIRNLDLYCLEQIIV